MLKITPNPNTVKHIPAAHGGIFSIKNPDEKIIDFSSNVNPLGCHPGVKKYLKKQLNQIHVYPDSESTRLRSNLKWFTGLNTSQILIGNGATELIYNFCSAFVNKKTKVLIPCPTFSEYEKAVEFSIKWPRGELGSLPADAEQFLLIEDSIVKIEKLVTRDSMIGVGLPKSA